MPPTTASCAAFLSFALGHLQDRALSVLFRSLSSAATLSSCHPVLLLKTKIFCYAVLFLRRPSAQFLPCAAPLPPGLSVPGSTPHLLRLQFTASCCLATITGRPLIPSRQGNTSILALFPLVFFPFLTGGQLPFAGKPVACLLSPHVYPPVVLLCR